MFNQDSEIWLYCRVSTDDQAERGTIRSQTDFFRRWCELHKFPEGRIYADEGVSGRVPFHDRPGGAQLLRDVAESKSSPQVALYRLDRIGRDPRIILEAVATLEKLGVVVRSMTEPFDTITPAGRLMLNMLAGFAGFERESILQRSQEGIRRRVREGGYIGHTNCYFGYKMVTGKGNSHLEFSGQWIGALSMTESRAAAWLFEQVAGGRTAHELGRYMAEIGVPSPSMRAGVNGFPKASPETWKQNIARIIHYPIYKGLYIFHQSKTRNGVLPETAFEIEVPHLALVTEEIWQTANDNLIKNRNMATRNRQRLYLLRGLIKCAHCGANYCGSTHRGAHELADRTHNAKGVSYRCNVHDELKTCTGGKSVSGSLEMAVWNDIRGFLMNPESFVEKALPAANEVAVAPQDIAEMEHLKKALRDKETERERLVIAYSRGVIDIDDLDKQRERITKESVSFGERLAQLNETQSQSLNRHKQAFDAQSALEKYAKAASEPFPSWQVRRELVEKLVKEIVVRTITTDGNRDTEVSIYYHLPGLENGVAPLTLIEKLR